MTFLLAIAVALAFGFIIGGEAWIWSCIEWRRELRRERGEGSTAKVAESRAAISAAVAPKKPTPPTPAPGGEYVQTTLFGYKNI